MTMDPRVEATLVEFARTQCVPPGYTLRDCRDARYDVYIWSVTCESWSFSGKTRDEVIAAAWTHSDRRSTLPPGYHFLVNGRGEVEAETSNRKWRSSQFQGSAKACLAAWAHHDEDTHAAPTITDSKSAGK